MSHDHVKMHSDDRHPSDFDDERQSHEDRSHEDGAAPVLVDQLDMTTFHHSDTAADGSFHDHFILRVDGASLHGTAVDVPGLNSAYGLYVAVDLTGHPTFGADGKPINGGNVFETLDTKLMLNPGHNDGAAHSPIDGQVGFENGTADDIELASGSIVSGHFEVGGGAGHADFVESLKLNHAGMAFLGGSVLTGSTLEEVLTSPIANRVTRTNPDGSAVSVLDGSGTSVATVSPQGVFALPGANEHGLLPALLRAEKIAAHADMRDDFRPSAVGSPCGTYTYDYPPAADCGGDIGIRIPPTLICATSDG